jgi:DNA polymerase III epsilon subunit-like protein
VVKRKKLTVKEFMQQERLVFVDIETAGLETWRPIIQLAAIAVNSQLNELEQFNERIKFRFKDADRNSLRKNSYDARVWKESARSEREVAERFDKFLRRHATVDLVSAEGTTYQVAQLVAHNANFDGPFLKAWFDKLDLYSPACPRVLCTLQKAMWLFEEDKSLSPPVDFKLGSLCQYFGVRLTAEQAHDALFDVRATVELYRRMTEHSRQASRVAA